MAPQIGSPPAGDIIGSPQRKEILYDGYYYDVTDWIRKHPGGRIIEFYTKHGEDGTIPVQQFHQRSIKRVLAIMKTLKRRPAEGHLPAVSSSNDDKVKDLAESERHDALTKDFLELHKTLQSEGYFDPSPAHITYRIFELLGFAALGLWLIPSGSLILKWIGIACFSLFQGRSGWLMHEGGHHSLTGNSRVDRFLQAVIYGVGDGMSSSWWSSQHNRHHAMPQRLKHDVDLETLPLLAFNTKVVKHPKQGKNLFVQNQAILFLAMDTLLVATLWKVYLHPRYVIQRKQYHQLIFMALHYLFIYQIGFFNYVITVWFASMYIFGNFALSHTHLPVTTNSLHWVEYALYHTLDIEPSWWCDWWMAYLNYQIEHHLFPTMPQFRHRLIVPRVRALALKHNIPYQCSSYGDAVKRTFKNLSQVSKDLIINF